MVGVVVDRGGEGGLANTGQDSGGGDGTAGRRELLEREWTAVIITIIIPNNNPDSMSTLPEWVRCVSGREYRCQDPRYVIYYPPVSTYLHLPLTPPYANEYM